MDSWDSPIDGADYTRMLSYFGLAALATFGALFLTILFVILVSAFLEFSYSSRPNNSHNSDDNRTGRMPAQYNFYLPENSTIQYYTSPSGEIRQIIARSQSDPGVRNDRNPSQGPTGRNSIEGLQDRNKGIWEAYDQDSMQIQRPTVPVRSSAPAVVPNNPNGLGLDNEHGTFSDTED